MRRWLYGSAVFANAALIFLVQPLVAKALLPRFGGAPAVWSASVAFFQAALLVGYLWSHLLARLAFGRQLALHAGLLLVAALFLPPRAPSLALGGGPVPDLLATLALAVGLPFVALSATSPLLQSWFARTGVDPYYLSSASNLGSLTGLLAYPLALEPTVGLPTQTRLWAAGFLAAAALTGACGLSVRGMTTAPSLAETTTPPASRARRLRWFALALAPSCLLLAVTTYVASNIGAIPLLWVVPLALYLLTYAHAFARTTGVPHWLWGALLPVLVVNAVVLELLHVETLKLLGPAHLAVFFVAAMACHVALAQDRPPPEQLTGFWLTTSLGGVAGGVLAAFVAPVVFSSVAEYPLALAAACLLAPGRRPLRVVGALLALVLLRPEPGVIRAERSFFGVTHVVAHVESGSIEHRLSHGDTIHGVQRLDEPSEPLTYFHRQGPAGRAFATLVTPHEGARVAIVGLGAGSLAALARPGQTFAFHEIDASVVKVAEDERLFTFLRDARARGAKVPVILGDARLTLAAATEKNRALVLDAFSGDAVPLHLLTRECLEQVYLPRLEDGGVIAIHISNRYIQLAPSIGDLAAAVGLVGIQWKDRGKASVGRSPSHWVVLARRREDLAPLLAEKTWWPLARREELSYFTDDFSCLVGSLSFR